MAIQMSVSPDANGVIRLTCGGVDLELTVVAPNAGQGLAPAQPPAPPNPTTSPGGGASSPLDDPIRGRILAYQVKPADEMTWRGLEGVLRSDGPVSVLDYDLGGKIAMSGQDIEGIAAAVAGKTPDLVRLKPSVLDVHALSDVAARLGRSARGPGLFIDLQRLKS